MDENPKSPIDPKDLMAIERSTIALLHLSVSMIVAGFVVEKFELFLRLASMEIKKFNDSPVPQIVHMQFYNYLGMMIVASGVILALFAYRYYKRWIRHLENGVMDTDRKIYMALSIFISTIGLLLLASMIIF